METIKCVTVTPKVIMTSLKEKKNNYCTKRPEGH